MTYTAESLYEWYRDAAYPQAGYFSFVDNKLFFNYHPYYDDSHINTLEFRCHKKMIKLFDGYQIHYSDNKIFEFKHYDSLQDLAMDIMDYCMSYVKGFVVIRERELDAMIEEIRDLERQLDDAKGVTDRDI